LKYLSVFIAACLCLPPAANASNVTHALWDKDAAGAPIEVYTLTSAKAEVKIVTYGARLISLRVPNRDGVMGSVILGHDKLQDYRSPMNTWMGATIGRYANRIDRGQFTLEGKTYQIPLNQPTFALHGGPDSFHTKIWTAKVIRDGVQFSLVSPDGDMGFPGTLHVTIRYTLTQIHGDPALKMQFAATTDKHTILNMTNHAYFNLADDPSKPVFDDVARIDADAYIPYGDHNLPTGEIASVAGTPFDFRTPHTIGGDRIPNRGYDHTFVLRAPGIKAPVAEVDDPSSGRTLQVYTTEPGAHLYAPRFSGMPPRGAGASGTPGTPASAGAPVPSGPTGALAATTGVPSAPRRPMIAAFCIETQHYPDSPHHPNFPSTELRPGQHYQTTTIYVFGVEH
jgi:aldose 1-epimerase